MRYEPKKWLQVQWEHSTLCPTLLSPPTYYQCPLQPLDGYHPTITIIVVIVFLANLSLLTSFSSDTIGTRVSRETLWSNRWLEASSDEVQPGRRGLGDWKIVIPQLFWVKIEWIREWVAIFGDGELGRVDERTKKRGQPHIGHLKHFVLTKRLTHMSYW